MLLSARIRYRLLFSCNRRFSTSERLQYTFKEGDRVLVKGATGDGRGGILTKTLRKQRAVAVKYGKIRHEDIIGKKARDVITIQKDRGYRLLVPTLDEYVRETPRVVTPIYPEYASIIVSLLDIHVGPSRNDNDLDRPLEILEAGTGHGALTLYLSRAIHGANSPTPNDIHQELDELPEAERGTSRDAQDAYAISGPLGLPAPFSEDWRRQRRAVVHTLDVAPMHSLNARKIVRGFRRGMYAGNVDFHIGEIPDWIAQQQRLRFSADDTDKTFLSHVILDLPACHEFLTSAGAALQTDGKLIVFCPSITQIISCVERIKRERLPLQVDTVLELGHGAAGGKEWDVRAFMPRARAKAEQAPASSEPGIEQLPLLGADSVAEHGMEMICRPRVGVRTIGGGFLGVWSKMSHRSKA